MSLSLPIETIQEIIEYLHTDRAALPLACSLVSSFWRGRAQHHLFRSIDILDHNVSPRFQHLLAASPHLAAHICVVQLRISEGPVNDYDFPRLPLPRATGLALSFSRRANPRDALLKLPIIPSKRLGEVFPGVRTLTIDTSGACFTTRTMLGRLVGAFPRVYWLRLLRISIIRYASDDPLPQAPPLSFTTLILEDCERSVTYLWMAQGLILPHIPPLRRLEVRNLTVFGDNEALLADAAILAEHVANTLEALVIEMVYLNRIEAFAAEYTCAHSGASSALHFLQLRVNMTTTPQGVLARAARLAREIAPDVQTHIVLAADNPWMKNEWGAELAGPQWMWKCTNKTGADGSVRVYDGPAALEMLGITPR